MITNKEGLIICIGLALCCAPLPVKGANPKWPKPEKGIKIYSYPEDQVVLTNETACFTIVAETVSTKKTSLTYQWQKNGTNLPGTTDASLILTNVQVSDVGFYTVVIKRGSSSLTVGCVDQDAPGARLFVQMGTNTATSGPLQPGQGTKQCFTNRYYGWVTFKTLAGSTWWPPEITNATKVTITDTSTNNYNPQYVPIVQIVEDGSLNSVCHSNVATFSPLHAGHKYQFTTFIVTPINPPRPNSGDRLTLDINWQP